MRGAGRARTEVPCTHPLRRRLTGPGHSPQPMSASRGRGPGTNCFGYLRKSSAGLHESRTVWTAQVEPAPLPPPTGRRTGTAPGTARTDPRGAELSRSLAHRPGPARHHHLRGTHGDQETLKSLGFREQEITGTKRRFAFALETCFLHQIIWTLCRVGGCKWTSSHNPQPHTCTPHRLPHHSPRFFVRLF